MASDRRATDEFEAELARLLRTPQASGMMGYVRKGPAPRYTGNLVYRPSRDSPLLRPLLLGAIRSLTKRKPKRRKRRV